MKIHNIPQRSEEWFNIRIGKITGTQFATVAAGKKATIETLCYKIATERVTGISSEGNYTNFAMQRGIDMEDEAISAYEATKFVHVQRVGFVEYSDFVGCSPDGLVGEDGGVEIKCPEPHTHSQYLTQKELPAKYLWQVQGAMFVTGRKWWDFASYCPVMPAKKQLLIQTVHPSMTDQMALHDGLEHCLKRIKQIENELNA